MAIPTTQHLEDQLCFDLHAASRALGGLYRVLLDPLGLTYPQYLVMLVLWEHGEVPVKDLATRLRLDYGTLSPLLKRLEAQRMVVRRRATEDERVVLVATTEEGAALRGPARAVPDQVAEAMGLGQADFDQVKALVCRLADNVREATAQAS